MKKQPPITLPLPPPDDEDKVELQLKALSLSLVRSYPTLINKLASAIMADITPIIGDYVINLRRSILKEEILLTPKKAAELSGVKYPTLIKWIAKGWVDLFSIDGKALVSLKQVKGVRDISPEDRANIPVGKGSF